MAQLDALAGQRARLKSASLWDRPFYFWMSLLIAAVVVYGFSFTVNANLFHPPSPRPAILYAHATLFTGWLVFLIVQSSLVRTRNVQVHRKLGWFGLAMGVAVPFVGVATAIAMGRLHLREGDTTAPAFLIVPFWDMVAFSVPFALAFYWRAKPEFHRRLILMASCALTAAAFSRFPIAAISDVWFYAGVDILILLGFVRDLIVTKGVPPVYLYGLPLLMLGQLTTMYTNLHSLPAWMRIAHALLA